MEGEVTVKDVPQMRGEGRWRLPVPSRIADLEEEIKELKEENADLKMRIGTCEALLLFTCEKGHRTPRSNAWCVLCEKESQERLSEEQHVGFKKQFINGRWVW